MVASQINNTINSTSTAWKVHLLCSLSLSNDYFSIIFRFSTPHTPLSTVHSQDRPSSLTHQKTSCPISQGKLILSDRNYLSLLPPDLNKNLYPSLSLSLSLLSYSIGRKTPFYGPCSMGNFLKLLLTECLQFAKPRFSTLHIFIQ